MCGGYRVLARPILAQRRASESAPVRLMARPLNPHPPCQADIYKLSGRPAYRRPRSAILSPGVFQGPPSGVPPWPGPGCDDRAWCATVPLAAERHSLAGRLPRPALRRASLARSCCATMPLRRAGASPVRPTSDPSPGVRRPGPAAARTTPTGPGQGRVPALPLFAAFPPQATDTVGSLLPPSYPPQTPKCRAMAGIRYVECPCVARLRGARE